MIDLVYERYEYNWKNYHKQTTTQTRCEIKNYKLISTGNHINASTINTNKTMQQRYQLRSIVSFNSIKKILLYWECYLILLPS